MLPTLQQHDSSHQVTLIEAPVRCAEIQEGATDDEMVCRRAISIGTHPLVEYGRIDACNQQLDAVRFAEILEGGD